MIDMMHACIESASATAGSVFSASLAYLVLSTCIAGCSGTLPSNLGVKDGRLAPCPSSPNCVSSQSTDRQHSVEPLQYKASAEEAVTEMKGIIGSMKRARIVSACGNYLHAEFTSALFRFVDDVEFYFDDSVKVIHLRSASRLGKSDFGVNRKRVEAIRNSWKVRGK